MVNTVICQLSCSTVISPGWDSIRVGRGYCCNSKKEEEAEDSEFFSNNNTCTHKLVHVIQDMLNN